MAGGFQAWLGIHRNRRRVAELEVEMGEGSLGVAAVTNPADQFAPLTRSPTASPGLTPSPLPSSVP